MKLINFGKETLIYGFGGLIAKSISIILLPLYTNYFTPDEYANLEFLVIIVNFFGTLAMLGMDSAQSRYFFKYKKKGKLLQAEIVSSILQFRIFWSFIIILFLTLFSPLINFIFFEKLETEYFLIAFLSILFIQVMGQSAEIMRLTFRPWKYILIISAQSWLATIIIAISLLYFDRGIQGVFLGSLIASLISGFIGWYQIKEFVNFKKLHFNWWFQLIRFGAPLAPASLVFYLMNSLDRWFLLKYQGEEVVGIFVAGAKISLLMTLAAEFFRKSFLPHGLENMNKKNGADFFRITAKFYFTIMCIGIILITYLSPVISKFFLGKEFQESWKIIGVLAWQGVAYGAIVILSIGIWKVEKTYLNLFNLFLGLVSGIILNWFLIPPFGIMGAAIATALANFIWVFFTYLTSRYFWNIYFDIKLFLMQIIISSSYIFIFLNYYNLKILITLLLILFIYLLIVISYQKFERKKLINFFKNKILNVKKFK